MIPKNISKKAALLFIVLIITLGTIKSDLYTAFLKERFIRYLSSSGVGILAQGMTTSGLSFNLSNMHLLSPFPISFQNVRINLIPLSLLQLSPALNFSGKLYEGDINNTFSFSPLTSTIKISGKGQEIRISDNPQAKLFGLSKGILKYQTLNLTFNTKNKKFQAGDFIINLSDLTRPQMKLPFFDATTATVSSMIPELKGLTAEIKGSFTDSNTLEIKDANIKSDYANISGKGSIVFNPDNKNCKTQKLLLNFKLSDTGVATFGMLLPVISNNKLQPGTKNFKGTIEGCNGKLLIEQ